MSALALWRASRSKTSQLGLAADGRLGRAAQLGRADAFGTDESVSASSTNPRGSGGTPEASSSKTKPRGGGGSYFEKSIGAAGAAAGCVAGRRPQWAGGAGGTAEGPGGARRPAIGIMPAVAGGPPGNPGCIRGDGSGGAGGTAGGPGGGVRPASGMLPAVAGGPPGNPGCITGDGGAIGSASFGAYFRFRASSNCCGHGGATKLSAI
jgi:hypothetical protein